MMSDAASSTLRAAGRVAERIGLQIKTTKRPGIAHHVDIDRIRPMSRFRRVLDVGAHWGESARRYRRLCPRAHITSFEPVRESFERLKRAVARDDGIEVVLAAVGAASGTADMHLRGDSEWHTLVPEGASDGFAVERVPVVTLDEYCAERLRPDERIDLLKIDTEGFEVPVLRGAAGLLAQRRVDFVYAEATFDPADRLHGYFPAIAELLATYGFRPLGLYEVVHFRNPWRIGYCNALFTVV